MKYAHCDTSKPDGFYVQFERVLEPDDDNTAPDERCDGYWPSRDESDAGYCPPELFDKSQREAEQRMERWENGDWCYIGVRARALCMIVKNGVGTYVNLESPGLWGIESDAGDYLDEVYQDEIDELKNMIAAMTAPIYEEGEKA